MTNPQDNAFPTPEFYEERYVGCSNGLTKREYFAALALQGLLAQHEITPATSIKLLVARAAAAADELVEQLNSKGR